MNISDLKTGQLYEFKEKNIYLYVWCGKEPELDSKSITEKEFLLYVGNKEKESWFARGKQIFCLFLNQDGQKIWLVESEVKCYLVEANNE